MVLWLRLKRTTPKTINMYSIRRYGVIKTGLLVLVCFFSLGTGTNIGADSKDAAGQHCYAMVENNKALFAFPVEQQESWSWYTKGAKDNQPEYSWEVVVQEQKRTFNLGAYLFKPSGRSEESGSLERLLEEMQCSVSEEEAAPEGKAVPQILQITGITCTAVNQRVVIAVTGRAIAHIFSQQPKSAHFVVRRASGRPTTCEAIIRYLDEKKR